MSLDRLANKLGDQRIGDGEVLVEGRDADVDFFFGDDKRRRDDEVADPGLLRYAVSHHLRGDLIVEMNGESAVSAVAFAELLEGLPEGESVQLTVFRGNEPRNARIKRPKTSS